MRGNIEAGTGGHKGHETFEDCKTRGFDAHSIIADPLFVDPENHNSRWEIKMNWRRKVALLLSSAVLYSLVASSCIHTEDRFVDTTTRQMAIELSEFIHVPGPDRIIKTGEEGEWDDEFIEASDAFEDLGIYYFYYHGYGGGKSYRIGVATASSPLGPFKKHGDGPILNLGEPGSWDDRTIACAMVVKEGDEKYYMWYSGEGSGQEGRGFDVGLAIADHPLGPWKKYEHNPVMKDFGFVGGVIKHDREYYIYSSYPLNLPGYMDGPLAVAVADKAEGPYVKHADNPILIKGDAGDWDDGGISEAEVLYQNGMFHMFYGGTRTHGPGLEDIGYAYSFDGFEWFKYGRNPVAPRKANPNCAALAEVHAIIEMPYIYLYNTWRPAWHDGESHPWVEHLGVQVLVTQRPFSIDMPALYVETLAAGATTKLDDAPPICLSNIIRLSMTVECKYSENAQKPIRIHVRSSYDGVNYDTADLYTLDNNLQPGQLSRKTIQLDSNVRFIKVMAENLDESERVSELKIVAILGG